MAEDAAASAPSDDLRVDVVHGRLEAVYDVGKPIGKGKFSTVYKAVRKADGLPVALKKIAIFDIMDEKSREKCYKEIRLVQSMDHENIIRYLDGFVEDKQLILVFEFAEAGDLKRQLRKARERDLRLDERVIWKYFSQIADAVAHMHSKRIMHRDLKPANIFLTLNGTIKVGDLGLGRLLSENTMEAHSKVGTPLYMSPEVLKGKGYEWRSDVWSLGCILYELAMLKSPFKEDGLNLFGLFQKITQGTYPPVADVYSPELRNLVDSMLLQEPADRPDMEQVRRIAFENRDRTARLRAEQQAAAATASASTAASAVPVASAAPLSAAPTTTSAAVSSLAAVSSPAMGLLAGGGMSATPSPLVSPARPVPGGAAGSSAALEDAGDSSRRDTFSRLRVAVGSAAGDAVTPAGGGGGGGERAGAVSTGARMTNDLFSPGTPMGGIPESPNNVGEASVPFSEIMSTARAVQRAADAAAAAAAASASASASGAAKPGASRPASGFSPSGTSAGVGTLGRHRVSLAATPSGGDDSKVAEGGEGGGNEEAAALTFTPVPASASAAVAAGVGGRPLTASRQGRPPSAAASRRPGSGAATTRPPLPHAAGSGVTLGPHADASPPAAPALTDLSSGTPAALLSARSHGGALPQRIMSAPIRPAASGGPPPEAPSAASVVAATGGGVGHDAHTPPLARRGEESSSSATEAAARARSQTADAARVRHRAAHATGVVILPVPLASALDLCDVAEAQANIAFTSALQAMDASCISDAACARLRNERSLQRAMRNRFLFTNSLSSAPVRDADSMHGALPPPLTCACAAISYMLHVAANGRRCPRAAAFREAATEVEVLMQGLERGISSPLSASQRVLELLAALQGAGTVDALPLMSDGMNAASVAAGTGPHVLRVLTRCAYTAFECAGAQLSPPHHNDEDAEDDGAGSIADAVDEDEEEEEDLITAAGGGGEGDTEEGGEVGGGSARVTALSAAPHPVLNLAQLQYMRALAAPDVRAWHGEMDKLMSQLQAIDAEVRSRVVPRSDAAPGPSTLSSPLHMPTTAAPLGRAASANIVAVASAWSSRFALMRHHVTVLEGGERSASAGEPGQQSMLEAVQHALRELADECGEAVAKVRRLEGRLNASNPADGAAAPITAALQRYRTLAEAAESQRDAIVSAQQRVADRSVQFEQLNDDLDAVTERLASQSRALSGTDQLQTVKAALVSLRREVGALDVQIGLTQSRVLTEQLLACERGRLHSLSRHTARAVVHERGGGSMPYAAAGSSLGRTLASPRDAESEEEEEDSAPGH